MANPTPTKVTPVLNNRESLIQLQLGPVPGPGGSSLPGALITLMPGMNFPDTALWERAKENPQVKILLTETIKPSPAPEFTPERIGRPYLVEGQPVSKDNPLAAMSEGNAVATIAEMFDVPSMKRFLEQETRPGVAAALRNAITKIETAKAPSKKV